MASPYSPQLQALLAQIEAGGAPATAVSKVALPAGFKMGQQVNKGGSNKSKAPEGKPNPNPHVSRFHKILGILTRPMAASAGAFYEGFDPKNGGMGSYDMGKAFHGFGEGISGHTHHTFEDVLTQHGHTGKGMGTLGLGLDILADPATYAGGLGLVGKAAKGVEAAEALTKGQKLARIAEAANPGLGLYDTTKALAKGTSHIVHNFGKPVEEIKAAAQAKKAATPVSTIADKLAEIGALPKAAPAAAVAAEESAKLGELAKAAPAKPFTDKPLPKELAAHVPEFRPTGSSKKFKPKFDDDVTKALFGVSGTSTKRSKEYMDYLRGVYPHLGEDGIKRMGYEVRNQMARDAKDFKLSALPVKSHSSVLAGPAEDSVHGAAVTPSEFKPITNYDDLPQHIKDQKDEYFQSEMERLFAKHPFSTAAGSRRTLAETLKMGKIKIGHPELVKMKAQAVVNVKNMLKEMHNEDLQAAHEAQVHDVLASNPANIQPEWHAAGYANPEQAYKAGFFETTDHARAAGVPEGVLPKNPTAADIVAAHPNPAGITPTTASDRLQATADRLLPFEKKVAEEAAQNSIKAIKGRAELNGAFSGISQANLRNTIASKMAKGWGGQVKKLTAEQQAKITEIYNHAEALVEHAGHPAQLSATDTTPIRLSTILPHLSPEDIVKGDGVMNSITGRGTNPLHLSLHEAAKAAGHVEDAAKLEPIVGQIAENARLIAEQGGVKDVAHFNETAPAEAKAAAEAADVSPEIAKEAGKAATLVSDEITKRNQAINGILSSTKTLSGNVDKSEIIKALKQRNEGVDKYLGIRLGTSNHPVAMIRVLNVSKKGRQVNKALGLGERDLFGRLTKVEDTNLTMLSNYAAKADHHFRTMFDTAYNVPPTMHELSKQSFVVTGTKILDAQHQLSELARSLPRADLERAWKQAQAENFDGPLGETAKQLHDRMDNIFGANGLLRNMDISVGELKPYMQKVFRDQPTALEAMPFELDHKVSGVTGQAAALAHEFDSWKHWGTLPEGRFAHPAHQILGLEAAAQKAAGRAQIVDHAIHTFGVAPTDAEYGKLLKEGWGHVDMPGKRLDGIIFPPEFVSKEHGDPLGKFLRTTSVQTKGGAGWQAYDKFLRGFKVSLTKYFPAHHLNNSIGQTMNAYVADGLSNPMWYTHAMRIINNHTPVDAKELGLIGPSTETNVGHALTFQGRRYDGNQVWQMFSNGGARQAFAATNDDLGAPLHLFNKVSQKVQLFGDARENMQRLGHFMYLMHNDTKSKTIEEAIQKASQRVNEVHANYTDLTQFEKSVMRRIIPFYTWQRKVGPLMFKQLVTDPGRTMMYPKIAASIGRHNGEQNGDQAFPQPNELVPSYMQDLLQVSYGRLGRGGPRSPMADIVGKYANAPGREFLQTMTPAKYPLELIGKHKLTGEPINSRLDYLAANLPGIQTLDSATNRNWLAGGRPLHDPLKHPDQQGYTNTNFILNKLSALSVQPVNSTAKRTAAYEVKERQKAVNARKPKPLGSGNAIR